MGCMRSVVQPWSNIPNPQSLQVTVGRADRSRSLTAQSRKPAWLRSWFPTQTAAISDPQAVEVPDLLLPEIALGRRERCRLTLPGRFPSLAHIGYMGVVEVAKDLKAGDERLVRRQPLIHPGLRLAGPAMGVVAAKESLARVAALSSEPGPGSGTGQIGAHSLSINGSSSALQDGFDETEMLSCSNPLIRPACADVRHAPRQGRRNRHRPPQSWHCCRPVCLVSKLIIQFARVRRAAENNRAISGTAQMSDKADPSGTSWSAWPNALMPPSTVMSVPLIQLLSSDSRNAARLATSAGDPARPAR